MYYTAPYLITIGRVLMSVIFIQAGINKMFGYAGAQGYMEAAGVPGALLPLVILLEAGGGLAVLLGLFTRWSALLLAFIGGLFIEKSNGQPVVSAVGLVLGDAACYVLGTAWFVFQMQCELGYALTVCVYPFIALDLGKIVVSCIVGALLRKRLTQAGVLKLQNAVSE